MAALRNLLPLAAWLSLCRQWTAAQAVIRDPSAVNEPYDYIIAGGGLTGLVVANRLTEDPNSKPFSPDLNSNWY